MASRDDKSLSLEEKLQLIDQEIKTLHQFCVAKGYDPYKVEMCAQPLFEMMTESRKKKWINRLYIAGSIIAVLLAVIYVNPMYNMVCAIGKIASIKVLPYWDWTHLYHAECVINNPYFEGSKLMEDDCQLCEDLEAIERLNNVTHTEFAEDYLKRDIPAIITDGMDNWPAQEKFSIPFLFQLYSNEDALKDLMPCMFHSNVRAKFNNPKLVLGKSSRGEITNWYAHWENCEKQAAKTLRQFYKRPYFIPPMVEMAESNWIFVASHYKGKKDKPADIALMMMMFAQVKGESKVILHPRDPCKGTCPSLYAVLRPGEILIVNDLMWMLDYMPQGNAETIAIGTGGNFDY